MKTLPEIAERIHQALEARTRARDQVLTQARVLTRHAAHAIRAAHREEWSIAAEQLEQARLLVRQLQQDLAPYPELYFAGYTQDAIKEFAEASIACALIQNLSLPTPEELGVEDVTYLNGLAEAAGELRRRCLDILRQGYSQEAERLLSCMDDIYDVLVTMDYPDAVTNGLRRQTDVARSLLERTRGDITLSQREQHLEQVIRDAVKRLESPSHDSPDNPRF
ncbi:translin family protein [Anaerolinea thermophila]|uniref:Translin family protein n=1 Tax=Anaerolinea thermophila (strain DSM 14523 / JCM 11388 / NBRC 100420 / UNI-1) TaxID=926569 RepID=E8N1Q2_ANATU|nr:translin family protein [Anaerolinea thermophila]BAJ62657.1 translin family protein [Anaerolinea thermophila UNI-1]